MSKPHKITLAALLIVLTPCIPTLAFAGEQGLYFGGGVGAYTLDLNDSNFDDDATVARIFAGLQFTDNLAIEGEYQKLFESEDDIFGADAELEADIWTISIRPILPLTEFLDLYGKLGYSHYDAEVQTSLIGTTFRADGSDNALSWGGGVDLNFGNLSLRGEVTRVEIDDADLNLVSAGLVLRF
ncbi:MAG: porin family protein [Pseudomonadota bacterium]